MTVSKWIEDLVLARECNQSNVIIVDTLDPIRYKELVSAIESGVVTCRDEPYRSFVEVNLNEVIVRECSAANGSVRCSSWRSAVDSAGMPRMVTNPLALVPALMNRIAAQCRSAPTLVLMRWLTDRNVAAILSNYLVSWSHDSEFFTPEKERESLRIKGYAVSSTVIVFGSASLLPEDVLKLCTVIQPPISTLEERRRLIEAVVHSIYSTKGVKVSIEPGVAEVSSGLNLHEVHVAALRSIKVYRSVRRTVFIEMKREILRNYGLEFIEPKRGFESVGGYDILKQYLRERVIDPLKNPEIAEVYGEEAPRGIILYGYPGCGKTWLSLALAKEANVTMVKINAADFLRGIVGETEQRIRRITKLLDSLAPIIVFIDEIDQLFMAREGMISTDSGVSRRMVNMLLEWLGDENRKAFVIGATNYVENMDRAALRPGRFDDIVLVLPPDKKAREEILRIHTEVLNKPKVPVSVDYTAIAERTRLWTGAELARLTKEVRTLARIRRAKAITTDLFIEALSKIRFNREERAKRIQQMIETASSLEIANADLIQRLNEALQQEMGEEKGFEHLGTLKL